MLDYFHSALLAIAQIATPDPSTVSQLADAAGGPPSLTGASAGGVIDFLARSDWVERSLFGILLVMSLITWYLIFAKIISSKRNQRVSRRFLDEFRAAKSIDDADRVAAGNSRAEAFTRLASTAINTWSGLRVAETTDPERRRVGEATLVRAMRQVMGRDAMEAGTGLTTLASIGSTSPFVGLLGTVWGVYHALVNIGLSGGVTVGRIAGPVGEALIMTGLGLVVAIPAVLAYNGFVRSGRVRAAQLDAFAHELFTFFIITTRTGREDGGTQHNGATAGGQ